MSTSAAGRGTRYPCDCRSPPVFRNGTFQTIPLLRQHRPAMPALCDDPIMSARSRRLACHTLGYSSAIMVGLGLMRVAHACDLRGVGGELATADTVIAVEAGEQAPRLTTLGLRRAR